MCNLPEINRSNFPKNEGLYLYFRGGVKLTFSTFNEQDTFDSTNLPEITLQSFSTQTDILRYLLGGGKIYDIENHSAYYKIIDDEIKVIDVSGGYEKVGSAFVNFHEVSRYTKYM